MQETLDKIMELTEEEKDRLLQIFTDPVKMLIILKILKNPGITSKELKEQINLKGTNIYYYLSDCEGVHPKTKEKLYQSLITIKTEETPNHFIMKKYYPNKYLKDLITQYNMFDLYEDSRKNMKWKYIVNMNIGLALLQSHLRDIERKPIEEFQNKTDVSEMISYNNVVFMQKDVYDKKKQIMKELFDSVSSENKIESLIQSIENSTHVFIFGTIEW